LRRECAWFSAHRSSPGSDRAKVGPRSQPLNDRQSINSLQSGPIARSNFHTLSASSRGTAVSIRTVSVSRQRWRLVPRMPRPTTERTRATGETESALGVRSDGLRRDFRPEPPRPACERRQPLALQVSARTEQVDPRWRERGEVDLVPSPIGTAAIVVGQPVVASELLGAEEHSSAGLYPGVRRDRGDRASDEQR